MGEPRSDGYFNEFLPPVVHKEISGDKWYSSNRLDALHVTETASKHCGDTAIVEVHCESKKTAPLIFTVTLSNVGRF